MPKVWNWIIFSRMKNVWPQDTVHIIAELTFISIVSTCIIWVTSNKLRNWNRWKVVNNEDGLRYVRTWHGWTERSSLEGRQATRARVRQAPERWLGWTPTHQGLEWIFWDPTESGRKEYEIQRAKSLGRFLPYRIRRHWPGFGQYTPSTDAEAGLAGSTDEGNADAEVPRQTTTSRTIPGTQQDQHPTPGEEANTGMPSSGAAHDLDSYDYGTVRRRIVHRPKIDLVTQGPHDLEDDVAILPSQESIIHRPLAYHHSTLPPGNVQDRRNKYRLLSLPLSAVRRALSLQASASTEDLESSRILEQTRDGYTAPHNTELGPDADAGGLLRDYEEAGSIDDELSLYSSVSSFSAHRIKGIEKQSLPPDNKENERSENGSDFTVFDKGSGRLIPSIVQRTQGSGPGVFEDHTFKGRSTPFAEAVSESGCTSLRAREAATSIHGSAQMDRSPSQQILSPLPKNCITPPRKRPLAKSEPNATSIVDKQQVEEKNDLLESMRQPGLMYEGDSLPPKRTPPPIPQLTATSRPGLVPSISLPVPAAPSSTLRRTADTENPMLNLGVSDSRAGTASLFTDQLKRRLSWYQWNMLPGHRHDAGMGLVEIDHMDNKMYWNGRPHMGRVRIVEEEGGMGKENVISKQVKGRLRRRKSLSDLQINIMHQENSQKLGANTKSRQPVSLFRGSTPTLSTSTKYHQTSAFPPLKSEDTQPSHKDAISQALAVSNTVKQKVSAMEAPGRRPPPPEPVDIRIDTSAWMLKRAPVAGGVPLEEFRHPHRAMHDAVVVGSGNGQDEEEAVYTDGRGKWKRWDEWQGKRAVE